MSWPTTSLGEVAKISSGDGAPQDRSVFGDCGLPFIRAGSLAPLLDGIDENQLELISAGEASKRRMRTYPSGTIVFAKSGMSSTKGLVYELKGPAHVVNHLAALECGDEVYPRFLLRWLQANSPARLIANPAYPSIKISKIRSEKIPLPPLEEQKRMAAILDAADDLRKKRRESLAELDALIQSTFLEMFGDPVINPMGWDVVRLGDVTSIGSGAGFPERFQGSQVADYPFYKVSDMNLPRNARHMTAHNNAISEEVRIELRAKAHPAQTIIFPKIGAAIATNKKRILTTPACFDNNVVGILPADQLVVEYLFELFQAKDLMDFANPGNPPSIRKTTLEDWRIPLPPLDLQDRFAEIVQSIEQQRAKQRAHLEELDTLFASLQSRAFKGEL